MMNACCWQLLEDLGLETQRLLVDVECFFGAALGRCVFLETQRLTVDVEYVDRCFLDCFWKMYRNPKADVGC